MDLVNELREARGKVAEAVEDYLSKFELSGFFGVDPILVTEIHNTTKAITGDKKFRALLDKLGSGADLDLAFEVAYWQSWYYRQLKTAWRALEQNRIDSSERGSKRSTSGKVLTQSYIEELGSGLNDLDHVFQLYRQLHRDPRVNEFLVELHPVAKSHDLYKAAEIYRSYLGAGDGEHVIRIYSTLLMRATRDFTHDRVMIRQITRDLEDIKSDILQAPPDPKANKKKCVIQRLIQRFNLVPDGPARPLDQCVEELVSGGKTLENVIKVLSANSEKRFGVIVIRKLTRAPIEHNIWTLIDLKYCQDQNLLQSPETGINATSLRRAETIRPVTAAPKGSAKDGIEIVDKYFDHEDSAKNYYFILESLNGSEFRFLVPWHATPGPSVVKFIPAQWFEKLPELDSVPSNRVLGYNQIIEDEVIRNLNLPFVSMGDLSREEIRREEAYWKNLRGNIKNQIIRALSAAKPTKSTESAGSGGVNMRKIEKRIVSGSTSQKVAAIITSQLVEDFAQSSQYILHVDEARRRQWKTELFMSYLRDIDKIQRGVQRDLLNLIHKKEYADRLGRARTWEDVFKILGEALVETLERYINRRSGIYIAMTSKAELLEKTLIRRRGAATEN
jgi:hypothetical protein